jgi:hypothetical protein
VRVVPTKAHLVFDGASGAALATTPWLSESAKEGVRHWLPHAVVGATEMLLAITTRTQPADEARGRRRWLALGVAVPVAALVVGGIVARRRMLGPPAQPGTTPTPETQNTEPVPA